LLTEPEDAGKVIGEKKSRLKRRHLVALAVVALLLGTAAVAIWNFYMRSAHTPGKVASLEKTSAPLSDKPSIAVLSFKNLSGDAEQEYFSDGVTNDIITDLSKFSELFVIASNSVFTYKNKSVKIDEIGQELGVRYVVEGSVQKAGEKVRINAQLIDASTGHHLWAERYERDLKDIFALQGEIVQTIVAKWNWPVRCAKIQPVWKLMTILCAGGITILAKLVRQTSKPKICSARPSSSILITALRIMLWDGPTLGMPPPDGPNFLPGRCSGHKILPKKH
jgi:TolB-like protein